MENRRVYNTRQKAAILDCMRKLSKAPVTVEQLMEYIKQKGLRMGQTTVYRNLDRLVDEGVIVRYQTVPGAPLGYQYVGDDPQAHRQHSHLICLKCGQMEHVDCAAVDEISHHMKDNHAFTLDRLKTVFYGYCAYCAEPAQS